MSEETKETSGEERVEKVPKDWKAEAAKVKAETPGVPCSVFLQEASGLARITREYQEPAADGSRPGLKQVEEISNTKKLADEVDELVDIAQTVQTQVLYPEATEEQEKQELTRGQEVAGELGASLEFVLDDDIEEPADEAFEAAKERAAEDETQAGLAQELWDYAYIAEEKKVVLAKIEGFDLGLIDEARSLGESIRSRGTPQPGRPASEDIELRNRLLTLIKHRVKKIRHAFRFVFREQPDIARRASSTYERRKRLAARRRKLHATPPKDA